MSSFKKYEPKILATGLVLINFLVKGLFLSGNSLAGDEPFSVYHAQMEIASIIKLLSEGNNPPLYEIVLHFWIKLFGISEFSVRFPSLLFSSLTVLYIFKLGYTFLNIRIALYASLLTIFSDYHILFAHEARAYALLGMLSVISMYYFMGIIQHSATGSSIEFKPEARKKLIILIVINTLIIYTHYFGFFILITQFLLVIFSKPIIAGYWKQLILVAGVIGLLYLPNLVVLLTRFIDSASNGTWLKPVENLGNLFDQVLLYSNNNRFVYLIVISIILGAAWKLFYHLKINKYVKGFMLTVIIPLLFLTGYSVFFSTPFIWRLTSIKIYSIGFPVLILCVTVLLFTLKKKYEISNSIHHSVIVFWFVFIFIFMFCISFLVPVFLDRYLMPAAVAFPLLTGICADYLIKKSNYRYIIPIGIVFMFIATVKPDISDKPDIKGIVSKIKELKTSSTMVYFCPDWFEFTFIYYYNMDYFRDYDNNRIKHKIHQYLRLENIIPINHFSQIDTNQNNRQDKILYLDAAAGFYYPGRKIRMTLYSIYNLNRVYEFDGQYKIYEYSMN